MILKKPYAFLIKNFKTLHIFLSALMIYLSIRINLIYNLFNKLANNYNVSTVGISGKYINGLLYFILFLIIGISFAIWFLMKNKNKHTKHYIFTICYYIVLFILLLIFNKVIISLEEVSINNESLRIYRDLSLLFPLGQYYFIIISILRGIGFNIKQFNFSKDIKDLEISEKDSEEIEINLTNNVYKYKRHGRKYLRELRYYFFENKYWILIIIGISIIGLFIYLFINYKFVNNNYKQGNYVNVNNYNFIVNNTFVTEKDLYGNIIKKDKKYIIVDYSIKNFYYQSRLLELNDFRLFIGDEYYFPITNKNSSFRDLGLSYDSKFLDNKNLYNYIFIYEIDIDNNTNNINLKVYDNIDSKTNDINYVNIKLNPIKLKTENKLQNINLNDEVTFDKKVYGNTKFNLKEYKLVNNYEYKYELCKNDECQEKTGIIVPNDLINNKLLMIDYDLVFDNESNIYKFIKNDKIFFNTFLTLSYTFNGKINNLNFDVVTNNNVKNKVFLEIPKDLENATEVYININNRDIKYVYKLK